MTNKDDDDFDEQNSVNYRNAWQSLACSPLGIAVSSNIEHLMKIGPEHYDIFGDI